MKELCTPRSRPRSSHRPSTPLSIEKLSPAIGRASTAHATSVLVSRTALPRISPLAGLGRLRKVRPRPWKQDHTDCNMSMRHTELKLRVISAYAMECEQMLTINRAGRYFLGLQPTPIPSGVLLTARRHETPSSRDKRGNMLQHLLGSVVNRRWE